MEMPSVRRASRIRSEEGYRPDEASARWVAGETANKRLREQLSKLPPVDNEGHSECPFAETLYAEKEEAERRLVVVMDNVSSYLPVIDATLTSAKRDWEAIRAKVDTLHLEDAKGELRAAEQNARRWVGSLEDERGKFTELLARMKETLAVSRGRSFPGRTLQKALPPVPTSSISPRLGSAPPAPTLPSVIGMQPRFLPPAPVAAYPPLPLPPIGIPAIPDLFRGSSAAFPDCGQR